jgi:hypothetical protein
MASVERVDSKTNEQVPDYARIELSMKLGRALMVSLSQDAKKLPGYDANWSANQTPMPISLFRALHDDGANHELI